MEYKIYTIYTVQYDTLVARVENVENDFHWTFFITALDVHDAHLLSKTF